MFQYLTVLTLDMLCHRVYPTSHIIQIGQSFPFFHPSVHRSQPAQRLHRAFHRLDRRRFGRCGMGETWWKEGVVLGDGLGKIVKFDDLYTSRSRNSIAYHHNETLRENGKYTCFKPWYWWCLLPWHIFVRFGSGICSWISYGGARHANNQHAQAPQAYGLTPLIDTVWVWREEDTKTHCSEWGRQTFAWKVAIDWLIDWLIEFLLSKSKTRFEHVYIDTLFWLLIFIVGSAPLFLFLFLARPSHVHSTRPPSPRKARKLKSTSQEDRCMWCDYMEGWFPDPI